MNIFNFKDIKRIVVLGAHPDDEIVGCGGVIHRFFKEKKEIFVITFTGGETAANSPKEIGLMINRRKEEMEKADQLLGITERIFLGYPSQELYKAVYTSNKLHHKLIELFRRYKPDVIFTHFQDNHRDHNAIYTITKESAFQASESILEYLGKPWPTPPILYYGAGHEIRGPNMIIQISREDLEAKVKALESQTSQTRKDYLDRIKEMIGARCQLWGSKFFGEGKLAEPFYISYRNPILIGLNKNKE